MELDSDPIESVCPILIGSDERIDTSKNEPDPQFNTALRILQVCGLYRIPDIQLTLDV